MGAHIQAALRAAFAEDFRVNIVFTYCVGFAQCCVAVAMLVATVRVFFGPAAQDRIAAVDSLYTNAMLLLLILGMRLQLTVFFDMALLIGLFGFVGTVALAKFLLRGEVIEP